MFSGIRGRIIVILIVVGLAVGSLIVNGIKLGLDLRGGMHLALEVRDPNGTMTAEQLRDATDQNLNVLRNRIGAFGVEEPNIQKVGDSRIIVELPGIDDEERAKAVIEQQAFLEWQLVRPSADFVAVAPRMNRLIAQRLREMGETLPEDTAATPAQMDTAGGARQ